MDNKDDNGNDDEKEMIIKLTTISTIGTIRMIRSMMIRRKG